MSQSTSQVEPLDYKVQSVVTTRLGRNIRVQAAMQDKSISDYVREILTEHMKKINAAGEVKA